MKEKLKQVKGMFPQNLINDLILAKLNKIVNLQDIIKTNKLHYKSKGRQVCKFSEYSLQITFLRDTH